MLPRFLFTAWLALLALAAFPTASPGDTIVRTLGLTAGSDSLALDPIANQLFVANSTNNTVSVVSGQYESEGVRATPPGFPTHLAVNSATNKLYGTLTNGRLYLLTGSGSDSFVTVGSSPSAVAVNPVTDTIYVANASDGTVSVVDGGAFTVTTTVNAGTGPNAIAINPATNQIYVVNAGDGSTASFVTIINGADNVASTVPVGIAPDAVAVNPVTNEIFVANKADGTVTAISGADGSTITIPVNPGPTEITVDAVTNRVYVASQASGTVLVIDGATVAANPVGVSTLSAGRSADALSINSATNKLYVADNADNQIVIFDLSAGTSSTLAVNNPVAVVADPATNRAYALDKTDGYVMVIDGSINQVTTVPGANPIALAVNPVTNYVYAVSSVMNEIVAANAATGASNVILVGSSPAGVAVNQVTNLIYVTNSGDDTVTVVDGLTQMPTATVSVGMGPGAIAVNPVTNQIYVCNASDTTVTVIDGATNATSTVTVGSNPVAIGINEVTNQIYVAIGNVPGFTVTVIDGDTNATTAINTGSAMGPSAIAVDPVYQNVYVANMVSYNVTVIDSQNDVSFVDASSSPVAICVNSLSNQIYVANEGNDVVTVIDGFSHQTSTINFNGGAKAIAVNPTNNQVYVSSSTFRDLLVIDGFSSATSQINNVGTTPRCLAINPVTNQVFSGDSSGNIEVITPSKVGPGALAVSIVPPPNGTITPSGSIGISATELAGSPSPLRAVYCQFDGTSGAWMPASLSGSVATISADGLSPGTHTVFAFASDGEDATSTNGGGGAAPVVGTIAGSSFVVVPDAGTTSPTFSFQQSTATANNTDASVTLTVQRNFTGAATVNYQAQSGTAVEGINFQPTAGALSFGAAQTTATITVPLLGQDLGRSEAYFTVQLSNPSTGAIGAPGIAGVFLLNASTPDLSLVNLTQVEPTVAPPATGSLTVNLSPAAAGGQWRLFGELTWRNSGAVVSGLTAADYEIEFKPVSGYQQPSPLVVPVTAGMAASTNQTYIASLSLVPGSLTVVLSLPPSDNGGWRLQGETDYRSSGATVAGLNPGSYIVEFEPVSGLATPESCEVNVVSNQLSTLNIAYLLPDSTSGATPGLADALPPNDPRINPSVSFTGQIQTDEGLGTGFVPLDRIVVTAVHVLFDDASLSYVTGARWFFQHDTGRFQSPAQVPRGFYALDGYAAQRAIDNSPGISSTESQQLDAAAMYFLEPSARGGASGYLASNSPANPWLTNSAGAVARDKFIAGYPASGVDPATVGRLYVTPIVSDAFDFVSGSLFDTFALTSYHGNSGGPLFVGYQSSTGGETFYPAAIYLGGTDETVVRAIDGQIIDLMNRAEGSGNGGPIDAGGGIVEIDAGLTGNVQAALGAIDILLQPASALAAGARWSYTGGIPARESGAASLGVAPGSYEITFLDLPGFTTPTPMIVTVVAGQSVTATATYIGLTPVITSRGSAVGLLGQPFTFQVAASPSPTGFAVIGALPAGLSLNSTSGLIGGMPTATGSFTFGLQASNANRAGTESNFSLTIEPPGELTVTASGPGSVTAGYSGPSLQAVGDLISITATPNKGAVFLNWTTMDPITGVSTIVWRHPTYVFEMPTLALLQANFVPNPFPANAGSYNGLITGTVDTLSARGVASIAVTSSGSFTCAFNIGAQHYSVSGAFNATGAFSGIVAAGRQTIGLTLELDLSGASQSIVGEAISNGAALSLGAYRNPFSSKSPAPQALGLKAGAKYAVALPHPSDQSLPQGDGFGSVTVSPAGAVRFVGTLGDGTAVTESSSLGPAAQWPFFVLLYQNGGALTGELSIPAPATVPAITGALDWFKPSGKTPYYPNQFTTNVSVEGEPLGLAPLNGVTQETLSIGSSGLTQSVGPFTVAFDAKGNGTVAGNSAVSIKINPATGLFTGKFPDAGNKVHPFTGTLLPQNGAAPAAAYGLFLGQFQETGAVEF